MINGIHLRVISHVPKKYGDQVVAAIWNVNTRSWRVPLSTPQVVRILGSMQFGWKLNTYRADHQGFRFDLLWTLLYKRSRLNIHPKITEWSRDGVFWQMKTGKKKRFYVKNKNHTGDMIWFLSQHEGGKKWNICIYIVSRVRKRPKRKTNRTQSLEFWISERCLKFWSEKSATLRLKPPQKYNVLKRGTADDDDRSGTTPNWGACLCWRHMPTQKLV